jgi:hypothetical protein
LGELRIRATGWAAAGVRPALCRGRRTACGSAAACAASAATPRALDAPVPRPATRTSSCGDRLRVDAAAAAGGGPSGGDGPRTGGETLDRAPEAVGVLRRALETLRRPSEELAPELLEILRLPLALPPLLRRE